MLKLGGFPAQHDGAAPSSGYKPRGNQSYKQKLIADISSCSRSTATWYQPSFSQRPMWKKDIKSWAPPANALTHGLVPRSPLNRGTSVVDGNLCSRISQVVLPAPSSACPGTCTASKELRARRACRPVAVARHDGSDEAAKASADKDMSCRFPWNRRGYDRRPLDEGHGTRM